MSATPLRNSSLAGVKVSRRNTLSIEAAVMIASINGQILEPEEHFKFKLWMMGLKVVNPIMYPPLECSLDRELLLPLLDYITLKHPDAEPSSVQAIFQRSLWLLTCHCLQHTRKEILSWMQEYLTSHTPPI